MSTTFATKTREADATIVHGRAAVIRAPGDVRLEEREFPPPAAGQLRLRMEGCGVCGSNLPVWEGRPWFEYPQPPGAPGHEGWGVVDTVGEDVEGFEPGDRVTALTYRAFADYDYAEATAAVKLPPSLAGQPIPGEPLACAVNVFRRCAIEPGQTVAVVGAGFLGALLIQQAAEAGARVIAVSRRPFALEVARRCGAEYVLSSEAADVTERVFELTGGRGCDRAIEAIGSQGSLDLASSLVRVRGRLIIAGFHQDGPRQVNLQDWNWRGLDVINAHERDPAIYTDGMQRAVRALAEKSWSSAFRRSPISTSQVSGTPESGDASKSTLKHELQLDARLGVQDFSLEEIADALDCAARRPEGFLKSLVWIHGRRGDSCES